ncbi:hypothetical protein BC835DRAFT_252328 [Cytidiella melzeri]|nr:hypothetical protein BC835DRAFT_252328 [Cytidiella melzeri]
MARGISLLRPSGGARSVSNSRPTQERRAAIQINGKHVLRSSPRPKLAVLSIVRKVLSSM